MGLKRTDEFHKDAVRIALTSGLTRKQLAADLGVGMSALNNESQRTETLTWYRKRIWASPKRMTGFGVRPAFLGRKGKL